jgi:cell division protein FtsW
MKMFGKRKPVRQQVVALYDKWLIFVVMALCLVGLMMVASSSVTISTKYYHQPFHFLVRQVVYLCIGLMVAIILVRVDTSVLEKYSVSCVWLCFLFLVLVLIPGIGTMVNGSRRWLNLGLFSVQVSELAKLSMILYVSGYLVRQEKSFSKNILGFLKPLLILAVFSVLLLLEPDFGATFVMVVTVMAMLFLTGVKLRYYFGLLVIVVGILLALVFFSPYRLLRLTAFLHPWEDQFNSGYQLTQSLIAFGRGGWFGVGLGQSIQKMFYLPEAHTDFLFAVFVEEFGLFGVLVLHILYATLVFRGMLIGFNAFVAKRRFAAFTAYGLTFWLGLQAVINMGVNAGLLPTKGLTLPLLSYGGASLIVNCIVVAIILRIDHENRWQKLGL